MWAMLLLLLTACENLASVAAGGKFDTSTCTLVAEVPADTCGCVDGVSWTVTDAEGATYASRGTDGLQAVGTTQTYTIAPGAFDLVAVFAYQDGIDDTSTLNGECQGGGAADVHLNCDCTEDSG